MTPGIGIRRPAAIAAAALASALAAACSSGERAPLPAAGTEAYGETVQVVTTLFPLEYFASRIGGARASVVNLIGAGVEAHDFEPTPGDLRAIRGADLLIYNGAGFEPWIERALASLGRDAPASVEAASIEGSAVPIPGDAAQAGQRQLDPHVWLDPQGAAAQVMLIRDALKRAAPASDDLFDANANALLQELDTLDEKFASSLAGCERDHFVTSHSAYSYLARRYGLAQIAIAGISPDAEPRPGTLAQIADRVQGLGVRYVLVEPIASGRLAATLASEIDGEVLPLHPLESLTLEERRAGETYFTIMENNLKNLMTALGCAG